MVKVREPKLSAECEVQCSVQSAKCEVRLLSAEIFRERRSTALRKNIVIRYSLFSVRYSPFKSVAAKTKPAKAG